MLVKEQNRPLDIFKIITATAGGQMEFQVNAEDLRTLTSIYNSSSDFAVELQVSLQNTSWVYTSLSNPILRHYQIWFVYRKPILAISINQTF